MRRIGVFLLLPLLLMPALAGCVAPQPAPRPPPRVARPLPPLPPPPPPEPQVVAPARWSFGIANGVCSATLGNPSARLRVAAGPGPRLVLTASGAPGLRQMAFSGVAGSWQWDLRPTGASSARLGQALDDTAQGRVQDLLSGGTLRLVGEDEGELVMTVPDAGISGRDWFGCVAQRAEPAQPSVPEAAALPG